jgi:hypothetical protein
MQVTHEQTERATVAGNTPSVDSGLNGGGNCHAWTYACTGIRDADARA